MIENMDKTLSKMEQLIFILVMVKIGTLTKLKEWKT